METTVSTQQSSKRWGIVPFEKSVAAHPLLSKEYSSENERPADQVYAGTGKKLKWVCSQCSYKWQATGARRFNRGQGCPACANQVATEKNCLAATHPQLTKEWSEKNLPLTPNNVVSGSHKKVWWKCSKPGGGHEWQASVQNRAIHKSGCPVCSGKVATPENNLAVKYPHLLKEYSTLNEKPAAAYTPKSHQKVWWECPVCKRQWRAVISSRTAGKGCPVCANRLVTSTNNLAFLYPEVVEEYSSKKNEQPASRVISTTHKKYWWKCRVCKHEWQATSYHRAVRGQGCPKCAVRKQRRGSVAQVIRGKSFSELYPQLALQYSLTKNPLPPEELIVDGDPILWWECQKPACDFKWQARLSARLERDIGCPKCDQRRGRRK